MAKLNAQQKAFMSKLKGAEDSFEKGRKGRAGLIDVEPGKYVVRGSELILGVNADKKPFARLETIVVEADEDDDLGARIAQIFTFVERSGTTSGGKKWKITIEDQFDDFCTALITLGIETDELEMSDLPEVTEAIAEEQAAGSATVKEKNGYKNA